jgi:hypothetical protein
MSRGRDWAPGIVVGLALASLATAACSAPDAVKVVEAVTGPYTFAYREYTGDYSRTAPVFAELREALSREGISPGPSVGIYLDDPEKTPAAAQRCFCGAIVEAADQGKLEKLRGRFKIEHIGRATRMVAECRFAGRSRAGESSRYYAALNEYAGKKGYATLEAFELYGADRTSYVMSAWELEYAYPPRGHSGRGAASAVSTTARWTISPGSVSGTATGRSEA